MGSCDYAPAVPAEPTRKRLDAITRAGPFQNHRQTSASCAPLSRYGSGSRNRQRARMPRT